MNTAISSEALHNEVVDRLRNDKSIDHYDLSIIAIHRGRHPLTNAINPFHWLLMLTTTLSVSRSPCTRHTVYQLRGLPGAFYYPGPEHNLNIESLCESGAKRFDLELGSVPCEKVAIFEQLVNQTEVSQREYDFNCQDWTGSVLRVCETRGWLDVESLNAIAWLKDLEKE